MHWEGRSLLCTGRKGKAQRELTAQRACAWNKQPSGAHETSAGSLDSIIYNVIG